MDKCVYEACFFTWVRALCETKFLCGANNRIPYSKQRTASGKLPEAVANREYANLEHEVGEDPDYLR